jgi:endonuclease YncB( thermonuclease family)
MIAITPAFAATYEPVDGHRFIVIDGAAVALPCKSPGPSCSERVRLLDIDAPEAWHPDWAKGLEDGLKAKA